MIIEAAVGQTLEALEVIYEEKGHERCGPGWRERLTLPPSISISKIPSYLATQSSAAPAATTTFALQ